MARCLLRHRRPEAAQISRTDPVARAIAGHGFVYDPERGELAQRVSYEGRPGPDAVLQQPPLDDPFQRVLRIGFLAM